ncbi:MAG: ATP-binding protein [Nanoarchaeota archaeon]|nr:ATP-binding protein [Nanoarchaeota archaeon]MBU1030914.1 ATP-binding protein [Nanoarchaeota archaeon]MBU1850693.1 ATP-binding protein [Nanoarchaeota archaeon]
MTLEKDLWYNNVGFYNNPFSIKPAAFHDEIVGNEEELKKINENISTGAVCLVTGSYGTGKTTILKRIIHQFKGKKRVIYFSCNRKDKELNFNKFLIEKSFFHKLFKVRAKNMILLLDEIQDLSKHESDELVKLYEQKFIFSIVLVSKNEKRLSFSPKLKKLIGKNIYELRKLSPQTTIQFVRKRIGSSKILSDVIIKRISKLNSNPRAILENCEDACLIAMNEGSSKVQLKHLKKI